MSCRALAIVEEAIQALTDQLADADTNKLLFLAHSLGELQSVRSRIMKEVLDDTRIYVTYPERQKEEV